MKHAILAAFALAALTHSSVAQRGGAGGGVPEDEDPAAFNALVSQVILGAADANLDRKVSDKEWGKFLKALAPKKAEAFDLGDLLTTILARYADYDGDKKLEFSDLQTHFADRDADGDNALSPEEIESRGNANRGPVGGGGRGGRGGGAAARHRLDPIAVAVVRGLFTRADENTDGFLDPEEWNAFLDAITPGKPKKSKSGKKRKGEIDTDKLVALFLPAKKEDESSASEDDAGNEPDPGQPERSRRGELLQAVGPALEANEEHRCSVSALQSLFDTADRDADGELSAAETGGRSGGR